MQGSLSLHMAPLGVTNTIWTEQSTRKLRARNENGSSAARNTNKKTTQNNKPNNQSYPGSEVSCDTRPGN